MSNSSQDFFFYYCLLYFIHCASWLVNVQHIVLKWETYLVWKSAVKICPVWVWLSSRVSAFTCFHRRKGKGKLIYIYIPMYISVLVFPILYFPCPWAIQSFVPNNSQRFMRFTCEKYLSMICMIFYISFMQMQEDYSQERHHYSYKVVLSLILFLFFTWQYWVDLWNVCKITTYFTLSCLIFRYSHFTFAYI